MSSNREMVTLRGFLIGKNDENGNLFVELKDGSVLETPRINMTIDSIEAALEETRKWRLTEEELNKIME